jgi:hypothetical protein
MGGKSAVNLESKLYRMITLLRHWEVFRCSGNSWANKGRRA